MILIVSGPGGVGKGTVVSRLRQLDPDLQVSRSWTTRSRRPAEPETAYVFVDRVTFLDRVAAGGFLEWTEFAGTGALYGTPMLTWTDEDVLLEIDLDGARQVKEIHTDAVLVLLVAPSPEVQAERLHARGDPPESIARRIEVGAAEERLGRRLADHVVVNHHVDQAAAEVAGILRRYRDS